jgi:dienelactone hydrolase
MLHAPDDIKTQPIKAKVLALHGNDDPMTSSVDVLAFTQEMTQAKADWQVHTYGNTGHAFTNPALYDRASGFYYQPDADTRSWQAMQNFLAEIFT